MFYCIETLQKTRNKIDEKSINKYFDQFIEYINLHTWYADDSLKKTIDAIFKLDIMINNNIIFKEIEILINMPIPPFSLLAILVSKVPESEKAKQAKSFIENYYNKYNNYWKQSSISYKLKLYEEWLNIAIYIKNKDIAIECLNNLPNYKKEEYERIYNINALL